MRKISFFIAISLLLITTSCSNKIYFSSSLKSRLAQNDLSINKVQFYNSKKIVLLREIPQNFAELSKGEIKFEKGRFIEQIIINKNTPGTCEFVDQEILNISFEEGYNKLLRFRLDPSGKYYSLLTSNGLGRRGYITYDTIRYRIQAGGEFSKLWVHKNQAYINKATHRVLEGKIVDDGN